ncbi:hypothetical protein CHS0354_033026 [Potamilus streckersoni]|uniref:Uncharacterized protein n=1 Tax=Potamilus streckersoni TaxID=2493646 RepID=A0AAE0VK65_9BIVA|nr:hypothetical protein CHS0354_033026 [Potamilus streckersoni]
MLIWLFSYACGKCGWSQEVYLAAMVCLWQVWMEPRSLFGCYGMPVASVDGAKEFIWLLWYACGKCGWSQGVYLAAMVCLWQVWMEPRSLFGCYGMPVASVDGAKEFIWLLWYACGKCGWSQEVYLAVLLRLWQVWMEPRSLFGCYGMPVASVDGAKEFIWLLWYACGKCGWSQGVYLATMVCLWQVWMEPSSLFGCYGMPVASVDGAKKFIWLFSYACGKCGWSQGVYLAVMVCLWQVWMGPRSLFGCYGMPVASVDGAKEFIWLLWYACGKCGWSQGVYLAAMVCLWQVWMEPRSLFGCYGMPVASVDGAKEFIWLLWYACGKCGWSQGVYLATMVCLWQVWMEPRSLFGCSLTPVASVDGAKKFIWLLWYACGKCGWGQGVFLAAMVCLWQVWMEPRRLFGCTDTPVASVNGTKELIWLHWYTCGKCGWNQGAYLAALVHLRLFGCTGTPVTSVDGTKELIWLHWYTLSECGWSQETPASPYGTCTKS